MKTKLFILVMLIVCFSCGTNNKPVSDAQKEKIKGEIKGEVNTFFKGCEEVNFDLVLGKFFDSPDFVYINNGYAFSYKECTDIFRPVFSSMINQKITIIDEKYAFPDNSTVLYSNHCKGLTNYKDGHAVIQDPTVMLLIFKKINDEWKITYGVESYIQQNARNTETSKELNQVELFKQILGTWKAEIAKDTFYIAQYKWFATGMEGTIKIVTKGKTITEGRAIIGYDKKSDKFIETDLIEGSDIMVYGIWFTSKNTCTEIPWKDISNPENTRVTWKYELKSPDLFIWNTIENNKTTLSYTFHREK
jgi:hypothetical protein